MLLAAPIFAGGNKRIETIPTATPVVSPILGAIQIPNMGASLNPALSLPALNASLQPRAITAAALPTMQAAAAVAPLTAAESNMAALQAFHETFQAPGADAASPEAQAALAAIYENAPAGQGKPEATMFSKRASLHPDFDKITAPVAKKAKARIEAFEKAVKAAKVGRFGLAAKYNGGDGSGRMGVNLTYTLDGRSLGEGDLERKIAKGKVTQADFDAAKPELDAKKGELEQEWKRGQDEGMADVAEARKQLRKAVATLEKARLNVGMELEAWGVPNVTPVGKEGWLKYVKLYRLGGQPTELGLALHEVLAPLVKKDPAILEKITQQSFDTAILELTRGLAYKDDPNSEDSQKESRLGRLRDEGHEYPEWIKAHAARAKKALAGKQDKSLPKAGLGPRKLEQMPTPVLKQAVVIAFNAVGKMVDDKAPSKRINEGYEILKSLHAALALPFGPLGYSPVTHKQLHYILPMLDALQVHEDVVKAVIRSYPLGESIYRMGIHKLWAQGLTGRGIKVAVIDDGVTFNHPDFADLKHKKAVNLTRDRGDHALGPHGTAMTDIIHAIAPEAQITVYQALSNADLPGVMLSGDETDAAIMKALDMAEKSGAQIISMSLGAAYGLANDKYAKRLADLKSKGITVIVSAGNSGDELPPGMQVGSPGSSPAALTIGAVDYHSRKADFSSKGQVYNPEKPMDLKDKPDIYAFGVNNKTAMALPKALYEDEPVPYRHVSGTSPATPHVSGLVALMLEAAKLAGKNLDNTTAGVVKSALLAAADHVAYRSDLPAIPVLLDSWKAVEKFLEKLK